MREVSKEEFKKLFLKYGKNEKGMGKGYWEYYFEPINDKDMIFKFEEPKSDNHDRMMIVSGTREISIFFMTDDSLESFYDFPGKEE